MQKELASKEAARHKAELERDARATAADVTKAAKKQAHRARKGVAGVLS